MAQTELTWIGQRRFLGVDSGAYGYAPGAGIGVKPAETL